MNRVVSIGALLLAVLGWAAPARAVIGTLDQVPSATLLLPYFEVDLANSQGVNTLLSINNASASAVVAQIVVYGDLSVPTAAFNLYLTGYDVQTISMRDILNGVLPQTSGAGGACSGVPLLPPSPVPPGFAAHMLAAHTGQASAFLGNLCAGRNVGDGIARGYVVVNTLNDCTLLFPGDPGYFVSGGLGLASNQNVLWGDYFYVNPGQNFAQGSPLVHIEAAPGVGIDASFGTYTADPETSTAGEYTFFGRYVAWTAADNREPLATNFAVRFLNGGAFSGGTDLIVWRDSKVNQTPFTCPALLGARPPWYPLGQEAIVIFDEQENPHIAPTIPIAPQPPFMGIIAFGAEAQRAAVDGPTLPVPFTFGWIYLNLNTTNAVAGANPPEDPAAAQAYVEAVHDAEGRFSLGYSAIQLDSATNALHTAPGGI